MFLSVALQAKTFNIGSSIQSYLFILMPCLVPFLVHTSVVARDLSILEHNVLPSFNALIYHCGVSVTGSLSKSDTFLQVNPSHPYNHSCHRIPVQTEKGRGVFLEVWGGGRHPRHVVG
jgi:hypothetical protein